MKIFAVRCIVNAKCTLVGSLHREAAETIDELLREWRNSSGLDDIIGFSANICASDLCLPLSPPPFPKPDDQRIDVQTSFLLLVYLPIAFLSECVAKQPKSRLIWPLSVVRAFPFDSLALRGLRRGFRANYQSATLFDNFWKLIEAGE